MYSALEQYDLPDMSPLSWQQLAMRFHEDDDLFMEYYRLHYTRNGLNLHCDDRCKRNMICEIDHLYFPDIATCKRGPQT